MLERESGQRKVIGDRVIGKITDTVAVDSSGEESRWLGEVSLACPRIATLQRHTRNKKTPDFHPVLPSTDLLTLFVL